MLLVTLLVAITVVVVRLLLVLPAIVRRIDELAAPEQAGHAPGFFEHDRVIDYLNAARPPSHKPEIEMILWGGFDNSQDRAPVVLYESSLVEGFQFGGTFKPRDFALPRLPREAIVPVVRLMVIVQAADFDIASRKEAIDALNLAITPVKRLVANQPVSSDPENVARLNFVLAAGLETLGTLTRNEATLRDSLYYYLCAFDAWASAKNA